MSREAPKWSLPYTTPLPAQGRARRWAVVARVAAYVLVLAAMVTAVVQIEVSVVSTHRKHEAFRQQHGRGHLPPGAAEPKRTQGAMDRWRTAMRQFWRGQNIYQARPAQGTEPGGEGGQTAEGINYLHPNMPFTVIVLSPLALLPPDLTTLALSLLKLLAIVASVLMLAEVVGHQRQKIPDWVLALGMLGALLLIVADLQHGNTNALALVAVVGHLWLFRRGRDGWAGAALVAAICLKMTPAIFLLYWLYQRNWRLLAGAAAAGAVAVVAVPLAACAFITGSPAGGAEHYALLMRSWLDNLILPGLVASAPYPIHINQSLPAMLQRLFDGGPGGNLFWNSDDFAYRDQTKFGWITVLDLGPRWVKWLTRIGQLLIVGLVAWAVGWRKLPRDDGRRAIGYGLVVVAMLLLNQRTWDQHAGVMLILDTAVWYAIALGDLSRPARRWALGLAVAALALLPLTGTDIYKVAARFLSSTPKETGELWAAYAKACGPTFWHYVLMLAAGVIAAVSLRRRQTPYLQMRQEV